VEVLRADGSTPCKRSRTSKPATNGAGPKLTALAAFDGAVAGVSKPVGGGGRVVAATPTTSRRLRSKTQFALAGCRGGRGGGTCDLRGRPAR
jgi:hypothetical protein